MAKRLGEEYWRKQVKSWELSGLTQVAYCAKHGLRVKTFNRWRGKELARAEAEAASQVPSLTLVPVSVETGAMPNVVRLHSPGGWRVDLPASHAPLLGDLLRQLP